MCLVAVDKHPQDEIQGLSHGCLLAGTLALGLVRWASHG